MRRGQFTLQSYDPPALFQAWLGDGAATVTDDSYGGLQITTVPKRQGLTEYAGQNPLGLTIDFDIDEFTSGDSDVVRGQRKQLEFIAGRLSSEDFEPLVIFVNGQGHIPHDITENPHLRWQVESLAWDRDKTILNRTGDPVRLGGSIGLRAWTPADTLGDYRGPAAKNRHKNKGSKKNKKGKGKSKASHHYVVKAGDTLISIASRELGDSKKWRDIADLNNIRDPRSLKVGQRLRMPS